MPADSAITIARGDPLSADLDLLMGRHREAMHAETPQESIHMLERDDLAAPEIAFYVMRDADRPVGMGAIKRLAEDHGEIKSMHILYEERGRGFARQLLDHLIAEARAAGMKRLSLETGVEGIFGAARQLYLRSGFLECGAFGDYTDDPNSVFMTRAL